MTDWGVAEGRFSRSFIENYFILNACNLDAFMTSFLDLNRWNVNKILHPYGNQEYSSKSYTVYAKHVMLVEDSIWISYIHSESRFHSDSDSESFNRFSSLVQTWARIRQITSVVMLTYLVVENLDSRLCLIFFGLNSLELNCSCRWILYWTYINSVIS